MSIYKEINTVNTHDIVVAGDYLVNSSTNRRGSNKVKINSLSLTNFDTSNATVQVKLDGLTVGSTTHPDYVLYGYITIPAGVTLVLDKPFSINLLTHKLQITNTTSGTAKITVIIE